jgi:transposase, IS30 family
MQYRQIASPGRYAIAALRRQRLSIRSIARELGRAPSTISREIRRNACADGGYRPFKADSRTRGRRSRSRRNRHLVAADFALAEKHLRQLWSPEQVAGALRCMSHESIYLHIWRDKAAGGSLWRLLRQAGKRRRKRYGAYDSRGRLAGKRHISERPAEVETRAVTGHWEIDTIKGCDQGRHTVLTLVERKTGFVVMGKLERHTAAETARVCIEILARHAGGSPRSRPTTARSSTATRTSKRPREWCSTSPPRTTPGSAVRTRTPTGCCASTSQGAEHGARHTG